MKGIQLLSLAALGAAFVIPNEQMLNQVSFEAPKKSSFRDTLSKTAHSTDELLDNAENIIEQVLGDSSSAFEQAKHHVSAATKDLTDSTSMYVEHIESVFDAQDKQLKGTFGHNEPNQTVYELIASSKYTTKLAALINDYPDLVDILNGTKANYTVFAPIDSAFEKIPEDAPKPSKEELKDILLYHVSDEYFPARRVLVTHTVGTLLKGKEIGNQPQRLGLEISLKGLTVNFYNRIIAVDIFGTNGVIHGVENIIIPPPKAVDIVSLLPGEFSTLELGLTKTGLIDALNDTSKHVGGTLFAPSNFAFQKLGPKINAFLFSSYGLKYLKALLKYHVVPNQTLYSDAYYKADQIDQADIPKGVFHIDLATALKDRSLGVDVARYGRIIIIKINGFSTVTIEDGIAKDGVIQVVSNVLIPPKDIDRFWTGEELTEEDLKERLEPYVEHYGEL